MPVAASLSSHLTCMDHIVPLCVSSQPTGCTCDYVVLLLSAEPHGTGGVGAGEEPNKVAPHTSGHCSE